MQQIDNDQCVEEPVIQGRMATAEEEFFVGLGESIFKGTIPYLNDVLKQLLTVSIALSGGTLMFLSDPQCSKGMKLAAAVLFGAAIICAFVGVLPYRDWVRLDVAAEIKDNVNRAIWWKYGWFCGTITFILLGLAVAFAGVLLAKP